MGLGYSQLNPQPETQACNCIKWQSLGTRPSHKLYQTIIHLEGCKGQIHKGHRESVLKVMNFWVISGCFQDIFRAFRGVFKVIFPMPFRVCPLDPSKSWLKTKLCNVNKTWAKTGEPRNFFFHAVPVRSQRTSKKVLSS